MDLYKLQYGKVEEMDKRTIHYIQSQIIGLNALCVSINYPIDILANYNSKKAYKRMTPEQREWFKRNIRITNFLSSTKPRRG